MVYLSLLTLNPRSRRTQAELRDPYQMHRTLSKAFADNGSDPTLARCLFRVEESDNLHLRILVQAKTCPNWIPLVSERGYLVDEPVIKEVNPAFKAGQQLAFRLRANPTVVKNGKRIGIYNEEDQLQWLTRKSTLAGFRLRSARLQPAGQVTGCKADTKIVLSAAVFDGLLEVADVEAFTSAWESGIGAGKGFGFGLLSVAPPGR